MASIGGHGGGPIAFMRLHYDPNRNCLLPKFMVSFYPTRLDPFMINELAVLDLQHVNRTTSHLIWSHYE